MVLGFVGIFIGLALGTAAGIYVGSRIFAKYFEAMNVERFDIRADYNEDIPIPETEGKPVPAKYRQFLKYFPNWATTPDFHRATWINHILRTLWPQYNQAIGKMILETVEPQVAEIKKQFTFIEAINVELIDFGTKPLRVAGIKVYDSSDEEVILECPLTWGSNARVRASAKLRFLKWAFYIPVEVSDFQMKVMSRLTLRPLVDTLPCMGAVTVTLLEAPHMDFSLNLLAKFDWMLIPGVRELTQYVLLGVIGDLLQYPNKMTFDIMEGGGVPPRPVGLLQVKVVSVEHITAGGDLLSKVDPYVQLGVRDDRLQRTKTVWNTKNPEFQEVFNLIVEDTDTQTLVFRLHDDDLGFKDPVLGVVEHDLADAEFVKNPKEKVSLSMEFVSLPALKKIKRLVKKRSENERKPQRLPTAGRDDEGRKHFKIPEAPKVIGEDEERKKKARVGTLKCEVIYVPFKKHGQNAEGEVTQEDGTKVTIKPRASLKRSNTFSKITQKQKGIVTITLKGCTNLESSDGDVDPYVKFSMNDPERLKPEIQISSFMHNEPNPHWNTKFDFAMISATSVLNIHVYDKKTSLQALLSSPVKVIAGKVTGKRAEADEMIGSLKLKLTDLVRNQRLRDSWALQETQKGDIQLTLDWQPIAVDEIPDLAEAGDQRVVHQLLEQKQAEEAKGEEGPSRRKSSSSLLPNIHLPHIHHQKKNKSPQTQEK